MKRNLPVLCAILGLVACGDGSTAPATPIPSLPPAAVALHIAPPNPLMKIGVELTFTASKEMSNGTLLAASALWTSSDPAIVTVNANGQAIGVGAGTATISASADGLVASTTVNVIRVGSAKGGPLIVDEFSIIEFQEPNLSDSWYYAPQLRVRAAAGRVLTLTQVQFLFPGFSSVVGWACYTGVPSGEAMSLNGEMYGEWSWYVSSGGARWGSEEVRAIISYVQEDGSAASVEVDGPIYQGSHPPYGSGDVGACQRGYRPPG
jgi:hypothetical protein